MKNCRWCLGPLADGVRIDAKFCSKKCRQAGHRFAVAPAGHVTSKPIRFGYADPPYPGLAKRYYRGVEVDHRYLIDDLCEKHPDGWALSTSAAAMHAVLCLCPAGVRVAIWVRGSRPGVSYWPRNAWEPVILWGGRPVKRGPREISDDVLIWSGNGRQRSHPGALVGMKSAPFCEWLFQQMGAMRGDTLVDWFPGSNAVARAWELYQTSPVDARRKPSRLAGAARRVPQ